MKNKISIILMAVLMTACGQEYPENLGDDGGNDKACNLVKYVSNISFAYRGTLPAKVSGTVNGTATLNECTLGNDTETYSLIRSANQTLTVVLWVDRSAAMRSEFFDDQGQPIQDKPIQIVLQGRDSCGQSPVTFHQISRNLKWQPVYSNSNKSCSPSGYSATL